MLLFGDFSPEETQLLLRAIEAQNQPTKRKSFMERFASLDLGSEQQVLLNRSGLMNQGNTCYQNVIFQTLLSCPSFVSLLVQLAEQQEATDANELPTWQNLVSFFRLFLPPALHHQQPKRKQLPKVSTSFDSFLQSFRVIRGEQEDALEFLEFFLDCLHEEFTSSSLGKLHLFQTQQHNQEQQWNEIGKKGKVSLVTTNVVDQISSPITRLFKGYLRSDLQQCGNGKHEKKRAVVEPFHCLHLNLKKHQMKTTVPEALEEMMKKEILNEKMEKVTVIDCLPIILTLHVKRFTYDPHLNQATKLQQHIEYPLVFAMPTKYMSKACQLQNKEVTYRLFSVISHHGNYVLGGHYTAACCNKLEQWHNYDDEYVSEISQKEALSKNAYLLFYMKEEKAESS